LIFPFYQSCLNDFEDVYVTFVAVIITFSLKIDVEYRNYSFMLNLFSYLTTKITVNINFCFCFWLEDISEEKLFI